MISDRELWACANEVLHQHGVRSPAFVAGRIGALVMAGDLEGVATWKAVARRMQTLSATMAENSIRQ